MAAGLWPEEETIGAAAAPFAGARALPCGSAPPSSGLAVVPFPEHPARAESGSVPRADEERRGSILCPSVLAPRVPLTCGGGRRWC